MTPERPIPGGQPPGSPRTPDGLPPETLADFPLWQSRFEALEPSITRWRATGGVYKGPWFKWMKPENLAPYLHYRLYRIGQEGGSKMEDILQRDARDNDAMYHIGATSMLAKRLKEVELEIAAWREESWEDFQMADYYEAEINANIGVELHGIVNGGSSR